MSVIKSQEPALVKDAVLQEAQKLGDQTPMNRKWRIFWRVLMLLVIAAVVGAIYYQSANPGCRSTASRAVLFMASGNAEALDDDLAYPYKERLADGLYDDITVYSGLELKHAEAEQLYQAIHGAWLSGYQTAANREPTIDVRSMKEIERDTAFRMAESYEKQGVDPEKVSKTCWVRVVITLPYGQEEEKMYAVDAYMLQIDGKWKVLTIRGLPYEEMVLDLVKEK